MSERVPLTTAELDACARRLDRSLRPVLDAIYARQGITRAQALAGYESANTAAPAASDTKPDAEPTEAAS